MVNLVPVLLKKLICTGISVWEDWRHWHGILRSGFAWFIHTNGYIQIPKLQSMTDSVVEFTGLLIVGQQRTCIHSRLESLDNAVHERRGNIDSYHCTCRHPCNIYQYCCTYVWLYEACCSRHVTSFPGFPHLILCIHNVSIITTGGMEGQTGIWNTACTSQPSYTIQPTLENQFAYSGIQHSIDSGVSKMGYWKTRNNGRTEYRNNGITFNYRK